MESILEIVLVTVCSASVFLNFVFALYLNKIEKSLKIMQEEEGECTIQDLVDAIVRIDNQLMGINKNVLDIGHQQGMVLTRISQELKGQLDQHLEMKSMIVASQSPKNNWENMKKVFSRGRIDE